MRRTHSMVATSAATLEKRVMRGRATRKMSSETCPSSEVSPQGTTRNARLKLPAVRKRTDALSQRGAAAATSTPVAVYLHRSTLAPWAVLPPLALHCGHTRSRQRRRLGRKRSTRARTSSTPSTHRGQADVPLASHWARRLAKEGDDVADDIAGGLTNEGKYRGQIQARKLDWQ